MDSQNEQEELEIDWKCNSLWTVEYPKNDKIGKLLSHFSMIPVIAPFALLLVLILKRNFASFRCLTGLVASTLFCRVLKSYFRHPRPDAGHSASHGKFGFPSDHSMSSKSNFIIIWKAYDHFSCSSGCFRLALFKKTRLDLSSCIC